MTRNQTELTYLRAEARSTSSVKLVIILYDLLIGALTDAVAALSKNAIEERSKEVKRAFLVLEQMEGSLDTEAGGEAARNLARFYATLRVNIMNAHVQASRTIFERQIQMLFQVRNAWASVEAQHAAGKTSSLNQHELEREGKPLPANWIA